MGSGSLRAPFPAERKIPSGIPPPRSRVPPKNVKPWIDEWGRYWKGWGVHSLSIDTYTGGLFETNAYYLSASRILVDAPEGVADWLKRKGYTVDVLLLTHGHVDHVWDAAQVQREHGAAVYYHPETTPMVLDPKFYERLGLPWAVAPIAPGHLLEASQSFALGEIEFQVLEVPGHCPGSLCFYHAASGLLFGGDVLFAGAVGRWDLPGGNRDLLLSGIREKLFPLGDGTKVLSGHGPVTTIGRERESNPYLS